MLARVSSAPVSLDLSDCEPDAAPSTADARAKAKQLDGPIRVDLMRHLRAALDGGKTFGALAREILALGRGPGKLSPHEYFYYGLYGSPLPLEEKLRFVGKTAQQRFHEACNAPEWFAVVHDKLLFQAAMAGAGLPVPRLLAIQHRSRAWPDLPRLATPADIARFVRTTTAFPFFVKPIDGMYSLGSMLVEGCDEAAAALRLRFGGTLAIDRFAEQLVAHEAGHVLQARLVPHPAIAGLVGDRLPSVRALVLSGEDGPAILRAVCKLPGGRNIADNYWRPGNMLAAIATDTGEIRRVVRGTGADLAELERHPDTGERLLGRTLPLWRETKALIEAAARTLPGVRTQAWDVALAEEGPVLLEVNYGGDLNLAQLAIGRGVLEPAYAAHLRRCGYEKKLPA